MRPASRTACFLALWLAFALPAAEACQLVLGVFPRWNATETFSRLLPMAHALSENLACEVKLETTKDFPAFARAVAGGRYDIVHYNPIQHWRAHRRFGYRAILMNEEDGERYLTGVIAVRKDSPVQQLSDLRGKTILFGGDRDAMVTYVATTALLRAAGLKPGDYDEQFALNPSQAILGLQHGRTDAATTAALLLTVPALMPGLDREAVRIVARTSPLPQMAWAVKRGMSASLRSRVQSFLAGLDATPAGRAVLANAKLTRLWPANDADYRKALTAARLMESRL